MDVADSDQKEMILEGAQTRRAGDRVILFISQKERSNAGHSCQLRGAGAGLDAAKPRRPSARKGCQIRPAGAAQAAGPTRGTGAGVCIPGLGGRFELRSRRGALGDGWQDHGRLGGESANGREWARICLCEIRVSSRRLVDLPRL